MDKRQVAKREFGSIGEQNMGARMRNGLLAISLMILGGGMSACADGTSWKEEVLMHDGTKLVVERSVVRKGRSEPFKRPPIGEEALSFKHPVTQERIRWKDEYGDDVGMSNFGLLMLEIDRTAAYIVAEPRGCLSYNKWGRPNPPYVVFRYQDGDWKRIPLQELPARFKTPNLILSSPDDKAKQTGKDLITAEMVNRINNEGPYSAAYPKPAQYKSIVREALAREKCPQYPSGPKAPFPITPAPPK